MLVDTVCTISAVVHISTHLNVPHPFYTTQQSLALLHAKAQHEEKYEHVIVHMPPMATVHGVHTIYDRSSSRTNMMSCDILDYVYLCKSVIPGICTRNQSNVMPNSQTIFPAMHMYCSFLHVGLSRAIILLTQARQQLADLEDWHHLYCSCFIPVCPRFLMLVKDLLFTTTCPL